MSNPTTPFGWQMPTNTDLVTDLPADFEVFGQAVATSMQDLLGGTTGQVLAKASNADMDFVWSADAAGMTNPMTTTGDTIYSSSGSTPARLGIGSAGQVMTVSGGGVPSWATVSAPSMTLISTTTLSGSSTTVSVASNTYVYLVAIVNGVTTSQNCNVFIQINSITGATAYRPLQQGSDGNTLSACNGIYLTVPNVGPALGTGNSNNVWVNTFGNPNSTSMQTINTQGSWTYPLGGYDVAMTNQVTVNPGAVISNLVFKCDFTFGGGTVNLYGVK